MFVSQTIKGAYWISSNSLFIQYCDSNFGIFSIRWTIAFSWNDVPQMSRGPSESE